MSSKTGRDVVNVVVVRCAIAWFGQAVEKVASNHSDGNLDRTAVVALLKQCQDAILSPPAPKKDPAAPPEGNPGVAQQITRPQDKPAGAAPQTPPAASSSFPTDAPTTEQWRLLSLDYRRKWVLHLCPNTVLQGMKDSTMRQLVQRKLGTPQASPSAEPKPAAPQTPAPVAPAAEQRTAPATPEVKPETPPQGKPEQDASKPAPQGKGKRGRKKLTPEQKEQQLYDRLNKAEAAVQKHQQQQEAVKSAATEGTTPTAKPGKPAGLVIPQGKGYRILDVMEIRIRLEDGTIVTPTADQLMDGLADLCHNATAALKERTAGTVAAAAA
jgi:hypothetical protein